MTEFWGLATHKHRLIADDIFIKINNWYTSHTNTTERQRQFLNQFEFIKEASILRHDIKRCV